MKALVVLVGLVGCDSLLRLDEVRPPKQTDAKSDGTCVTVGHYGAGSTGMFQGCVQGLSRPIAGPISTDDSITCSDAHADDGTVICLLQADTITISTTLRALGTKPLVIAASSSIEVDSTIDVSAAPGPVTAPAARACSTFAGQNGANGGGGGAGGSFGTVGGAGGSAPPAAGAPAAIAMTATTMIGGCAGGNGGSNNGAVGGGGGGGVVYLVAPTIHLTANAVIDASGAGGTGGFAPGGGGGGGGTGGLIVFDTVRLSIDPAAQIFANGGGGGAGGKQSAQGSDGSISTMYDLRGAGGPANGGNGAVFGSDGAAGAAADAMTKGGGGGGGGLGWVLLYGTMDPGVVKSSPAITPGT